MNEGNAHFLAFTEAIIARQPQQFERIVKTAYESGRVRRDDLLAAVELARLLADVPGPVLSQAKATTRAWHPMVARRGRATGPPPAR